MYRKDICNFLGAMGLTCLIKLVRFFCIYVQIINLCQDLTAAGYERRFHTYEFCGSFNHCLYNGTIWLMCFGLRSCSSIIFLQLLSFCRLSLVCL